MNTKNSLARGLCPSSLYWALDQVFNSRGLSGIISNAFTSGKKGHCSLASRDLRELEASCLISWALSAELSELPNAMSKLCKALNHPDFSLTEAELRSRLLLIKWQEHLVKPQKLDLNDFHPFFSLPPTWSILIIQRVKGQLLWEQCPESRKQSQGELGPFQGHRVSWGRGWK